MQHLKTTDDLTTKQIEQILNDALRFKLQQKPVTLLKNRLLFTLFFENSTRTRSSFEVAAKRLGASVVHLDPSKAVLVKAKHLKILF